MRLVLISLSPDGPTVKFHGQIPTPGNPSHLSVRSPDVNPAHSQGYTGAFRRRGV